MKSSIRSLSACLGLVTLAACTWMSNTEMTQAQVKNFETRTVDAGSEAVYNAATEALFDLGYLVTHSEKASGIIVGERREYVREWIPGAEGQLGRFIDRPIVHNLTLLIRPISRKSSNVRIKTSIDGRSRLNKAAIDQVWLYIERQVLMESPAPKKPPSKI